jgi:competence ComEA-like helix-hairpin-helix protein
MLGIRSIPLLAFVTLAIAICRAQSGTPLPEGKGREAVRKMCGGACHDLEVVVNEHLSRQGWSNVVDTMVSRGASGSDEEIAEVVDYLATHFGRQRTSNSEPKIHVNTETVNELAADLGVPQQDAQNIVAYREKNGSFKTWTDLGNALDLKKIESKKDRVVF